MRELTGVSGSIAINLVYLVTISALPLSSASAVSGRDPNINKATLLRA
jgi:hypothetical protein